MIEIFGQHQDTKENNKMLRLPALILLFTLCFTITTMAQDQCGVLDTISYPIDTNTFQLVQNFATSSPRHQGRFHTGEDWFGGRGSSLGQPVRAAARGLVVYSSPSAWGVDGGVIIIRHTLDDGGFLYTQYGHLEQTETVRFPPRLSCVNAGEVIGVIGDARPAPHLHFEIRVYSPSNPNPGDNPGPGYTRTDPELLGWRRPMQIITNMQARLSRGYEWHTTLSHAVQNPPPLVLNDNSLIVIDGDRLRRITSDGRVLWRVGLSTTAVSLHGYEARTYVTFIDGRVVQVDVENGNFLEAWQLEGFMPDSAPIDLKNARLYHTSDNTLTAVSTDGRTILWQTPDVPPFTYGVASQNLIGLVIHGALWTFSSEGQLLDQAELADGVHLAAHPDGGLIAYTQGGLWQINPAGEWSVLLIGAPPGGKTSGAVMLTDGRLYLVDKSTLYAYESGQLSWQAQLPQTLSGQVSLAHDNDHRLIIASTHGHFIVARESGGFCGFTQLYGTDQTSMWYDLGTDGTLRFAVGDQIIGLNWERFTNSC